MPVHRPLLISVMQFEEELKSGARTIFDVIDTAQRLNVDGVELRRELWPAWQTELATARRYLEDRHLLVTYATFVTLFSADNQDQVILRQDIDAAKALGAPQLRVFPGPLPAEDDEAGWAAGRSAVDYAQQQGIKLALENFARTPGGTLAEIQQVLAHIQHPALGTNIDIGNYVRHGEDVVTAIHTLGSRAVSAHLKDQPTDLDQLPTYLGGGDQELAPIFAAFATLPQRLIYCFEFRSGDDIEEGIRRSVAYLRSQGV
ncbi:MAG: sugar phosphate isomerase/epimerase [Chloroflexi bacterium]|nr:sugar phosphate isomerase/epimerase [Chloroflexota bacterium]